VVLTASTLAVGVLLLEILAVLLVSRESTAGSTSASSA
jgi:hypothetical protein